MVWEYIREHAPQDDAQDRRRTRADDQLRAPFDGRDSVTMFELTKFVLARLGVEPCAGGALKGDWPQGVKKAPGPFGVSLVLTTF